MDNWNPFEEAAETTPGLDRIVVGGDEIKPGDRVRLRPLGRADIFDMALDGKIATVVSIEQRFRKSDLSGRHRGRRPGQRSGPDREAGTSLFFRRRRNRAVGRRTNWMI